MRRPQSERSGEDRRERERKAERMMRLIGRLPDGMLEEAMSGNAAADTNTQKTKKGIALVPRLAAACLCLLFAGILWARILPPSDLAGHPKRLTEREEIDEAAPAEGGAEIPDCQEQEDMPSGIFYRGQRYVDAKEPPLFALLDEWSLLGYLTGAEKEHPSGLYTEDAALIGCPVYGRKEGDGEKEGIQKDAGIYVAEKGGYRRYVPEKNSEQKGENHETNKKELDN